MQEPVHPLTDQTRFIKELIAVYKDQPVLWDKNHPHYRNRSERNEANEVLLHKCKEYFPEADEDFVKLKIDSLRACFRKEWNKVCMSRSTAERPEDIYKPSLWYYNLLLYTVGEECMEIKMRDVSRIFYWNKEYTMILIDLLKKNPCMHLGDAPHLNLDKRRAALKSITKEMNVITGKLFTKEDVKKKIQLLKGQYRFECRKIKLKEKIDPDNTYKPNLWCFEMLGFLNARALRHVPMQGESKKRLRRSGRLKMEVSLNTEVDNIQDIKEETYSEQYDESYLDSFQGQNSAVSEDASSNSNYDDIFDTIGKNVAYKLRDMSDEQRKFAENLINEIMYHGQMENLNENSRLSIT